jgi:hypothetical protein
MSTELVEDGHFRPRCVGDIEHELLHPRSIIFSILFIIDLPG